MEAPLFCAGMGRLHRIRVFACSGGGVAVVRGPRRLAVVCYFPQNSLMWRHCRIAMAIMRKRLRLCGKGREEIPGRPYVGESPVQGRHECFVYRCGGDGFPVP